MFLFKEADGLCKKTNRRPLTGSQSPFHARSQHNCVGENHASQRTWRLLAEP